MEAATTIVHHLERHASAQGDRAALHDKVTGSWRTRTWSEYNQATRDFAKGLIAHGVGSGQVVAVLGANRPEWVIAALGAMRIGAISTGVYTTCSPEEIGYVVEHSEAPVMIVETLEQLDRVLEVWESVPTLKYVVLMEGAGEHDDARVKAWADFMVSGATISNDSIAVHLEGLTGDQIAEFIYTSGTTGPPKAVMLSHENLEWTSRTLGSQVHLTPDDVGLSYLPLSHIAEQQASLLMAVIFGYQVHFCHDGLQVADFLKEVRPTFFFGVPRVWERFEAGVKGRLAEATGAKAKIAQVAQSAGVKYIAAANTGATPGKLLERQYKAADKVVFSKIHAALGLDRCRLFVSGAAPIPAASLEFFSSIGVTVTELYGQSEDSGPTTTNLPGANKFGTVGKAVEGVEIKIADDGEILVRGKNVFAGYYKNPEATAETLVDGWLHSGDLGEIDSDGYLSIIGRKKDIIITSGGKNVAPQNIEESLSGIDIVGAAVVVGDGQRFLVALLTLEPEAAGRFAEEHGLDAATMHDDPKVRSHIEEAINTQVNPLMARVEHVRNFAVLANEFTMEGGELTPTLKIKRNIIAEKYADDIAALYDSGQVM